MIRFQKRAPAMMLRTRLLAGLVAVAAIAAPLSAHAHRGWILPSFTVLSGEDPWVGIDGAISNELFYPDHRPMQPAGLKVLDPDGMESAVQNATVGKFRTTFDLQLAKVGTYKVFTSTGASRNETFITRGSPTTGALKPTGVGLELQPVTHPNDLVAGDGNNKRRVAAGHRYSSQRIHRRPSGSRVGGENEIRVDQHLVERRGGRRIRRQLARALRREKERAVDHR